MEEEIYDYGLYKLKVTDRIEIIPKEFTKEEKNDELKRLKSIRNLWIGVGTCFATLSTGIALQSFQDYRLCVLCLGYCSFYCYSNSINAHLDRKILSKIK